MNRSEEISARVTPEEKKLVEQKAEEFGLKVSEYLRTIAMNTKEIKVNVIY